MWGHSYVTACALFVLFGVYSMSASSPHQFRACFLCLRIVFARIICRAIGFRMRFVEHLRCVACERCFSVICSRTFARGMCVTCCAVVASWYILLCWLVSACVVCLRISPLHVRITIRITWLCPLLYLLCCLVSCMCVRTSPHHLRIMSASCPHHLAVLFCHMCLPLWFASAPHQVRTF